MKKENFLERRSDLRVSKDTFVNYSFKKSIGKIESGQRMSMNISCGGAMFSFSQFLRKGQSVNLNIQIPTLLKTIKAVAKVAWVNKLGGKKYLIALQFFKMNKKDKEKLSAYIYS